MTPFSSVSSKEMGVVGLVEVVEGMGDNSSATALEYLRCSISVAGENAHVRTKFFHGPSSTQILTIRHCFTVDNLANLLIRAVITSCTRKRTLYTVKFTVLTEEKLSSCYNMLLGILISKLVLRPLNQHRNNF